jgi:hypothetical protein
MLHKLEFPATERSENAPDTADSDALIIRLADYQACGHALKRREAIKRAVDAALARTQHGGDAA